MADPYPIRPVSGGELGAFHGVIGNLGGSP